MARRKRSSARPSAPSANGDLHGSAPDKSAIALLLIDVINDLEFPEANAMLKDAEAMARNLRRPETLLRYLEVKLLS